MTLKCENCGNEYAKAFRITMEGEEHVFDSFECAINSLAPRCAHCGTRIIGHGIEANQHMFCCSSCANAEGVTGSRDHVS